MWPWARWIQWRIWKQAVMAYYIYLFIHQWLYGPLLGPGRFFSFVILYTVSRTPWTGDLPVARPLPTHRTT
jgi:hypothetical protein